MKKLLAILLLILLSLSFTACGNDEDTLELNYRVEYGYYTVTGIISDDYKALSDITIGESLKSIGDFAFADCVSLKNVLFESNSSWFCHNFVIRDYELSDHTRAAEYLTMTYQHSSWKRK